jgi:cytochrome c5
MSRGLGRMTLICATLAFTCACVMDKAAFSAQDQPPKKAVSASTASSEGEKRFRTHCGRCHNPPEDLSPREARAVIRQMRVRAMLSAEDEKLILEYIAP